MTDYEIVRQACARKWPDIDFDSNPMQLIHVHSVIPTDEAALAERNFDGDKTSDYLENAFQTFLLWDQNKDDLSQQSPETWKFLADLLRGEQSPPTRPPLLF